MVTIHEEPDCGNSPRKEILRDLVVALAQRDVEHIDAVLADDVSWTVVGEQTVSGRAAAKEMVLQHWGPDVGNPDPKAMRLIYADRQLNADQLSAILR